MRYCVSLGISISCGYACAFLQQPTNNNAVQEAAETYEEALRKELKLRWISPQLGWRLDFPDDPASREEDQAAARQFLGLEITDDGNIIELR